MKRRDLLGLEKQVLEDLKDRRISTTGIEKWLDDLYGDVVTFRIAGTLGGYFLRRLGSPPRKREV